MKLNRLLKGKNGDSGTEISGSFGGQASAESLLGNGDDTTGKGDDSNKGKSEESGRGRVATRLNQMRRSLSERPSLRKRSKSEVGKRLKKLQGDFGEKTKKKGGSKSVGGVFKGTSREVDSKIDSLALERTASESKINKESGGFDSLFDQPAGKPVKKLRGGRRRSVVPENDKDRENEAPRRARSTSARRRSSSAVSSTRKKRSSSKRRASSKPRKPSGDTPKDLPNSVSTADDKQSVSTLTSKDSKKKKKKKKDKKKKKEGSELELMSIPSKVDVEDDYESQGSITMNDSFSGKKKKSKDKSKKPKAKKTKNTFPEFPANDFGDGLEGLAEEFRRSKEKYGEDTTKETLAEYPSGKVSNSKENNEVNNMFENAWNDTEKKNIELQRSPSFVNDDNHNPFAGENTNNPFKNDTAEADMLRKAVDYETQVSDTSGQQEEILKLQQQLSTALQKQLTMSEEHIKEKNEFINVSRELERVRVELMASKEQQNDIMTDLKERDRNIEEERVRIENLEEAIDKQLGKEDELIKNVQEQEEEIEKLLDEIQKFENKLENGESGDAGASFVELRNLKKDLSNRDKELASQKLRIEELEKELTDAMTVPQLQIEELDQENKALQGRLKGERLEYTSKLSAKDDALSSLRAELTSYTASPDAQDLSAARQKLMEAREDATTVREDLAATKKVIEQLHGEREDFMEEFNLMKDNNSFMEKTVKELTEKADGLAKKVLEWTEKTYDWKEKAEKAERKIKESNDDRGSDIGESEVSGDVVDPQGMFLQSVMEKGKKGGKAGRWGLFNKNSPENHDMSPEEIRVEVLEEQNQEYEAKIAQLSSDIVKMQSGHKEEVYSMKKKIAQVELENDALSLQNSTLEKLNAEATLC